MYPKSRNIQFLIRIKKNMAQPIKREKAPNFTLPDQDGKMRSLIDYKGTWVLVYFYPKDDTPGCTKQACGFRDISTKYRERGIEVIGISKDTIASHKRFADKYHLSFSLLSDESRETIKAYGAWGEKKFMGRTFGGIRRISFLIGPEGDIYKTYESFDLNTHANTILEDCSALRKERLTV